MTYIHGCSGSGSIVGKMYNFPYNGTDGTDGSVQPWSAPCSGKFKFEAWGAGGINTTSVYYSPATVGNGSYTVGSIYLSEGRYVYAYVGGQGKYYDYYTPDSGKELSGGWNGGGGTTSYCYAMTGSGATDFRLSSGAWDNFDGLKSRIMVAAGAGSGQLDTGGWGGTIQGSINYKTSVGGHGYTLITSPATQTGVGSITRAQMNGSANYNNDTLGGFGFGGHGAGHACMGAGGGGGWYGGPGIRNAGNGGGDSSYISGHSGCKAINSSSTKTSISHSSDSVHSSGLAFTSTGMTAGNASMPAPGGGSETGHNGNGYARITVVE